jgi:hypothetical protein
MSQYFHTQTLTLTSGGGTINLDIASPFNKYIIEGNTTLTSNWTIQPTDTESLLTKGFVYEFKYNANIALNGNSITFFGTVLPEIWANKNVTVICTYDGSVWLVNFEVDLNQTSVISSTSLTGTGLPANTYTINSINSLINGAVRNITYNTVTALPDLAETVVSTTGGSGTDLIVSAEIDSLVLTIRVLQIGKDFVIGDVLTIPGTELGGVTPGDDVTFTVSEVFSPDKKPDGGFPLIINLTPDFSNTTPLVLDLFSTGDFGYPISGSITVKTSFVTELIPSVVSGIPFDVYITALFMLESGVDPNKNYTFTIVDNLGNYSAPFVFPVNTLTNI